MTRTLELLKAVWSDIPLSEWPPNAYRWLGLNDFESDMEVINEATDALMRKLHALKKDNRYQSEESHETIARLMKEVLLRCRILLDKHPQLSKVQYDDILKRNMGVSSSQRQHPLVRAKRIRPEIPPIPDPPPAAGSVSAAAQDDGVSKIVINQRISATTTRRRLTSKSNWLAHFLGIAVGCMVGVILAFLLAALMELL